MCSLILFYLFYFYVIIYLFYYYDNFLFNYEFPKLSKQDVLHVLSHLGRGGPSDGKEAKDESLRKRLIQPEEVALEGLKIR